MAGTGATGMGFPEEYDGGGDIGASIAAFETLGYGDLSVLVKVGVQFGLFGGAILQTRHEAAPRRLPRRHRERPAARLLRDDRDRARLQRAGPRHRRDLRRRDRRVRGHDHHAERRQGLHRQRRSARPGGRGLRPAWRWEARGTGCTRSSYPSGTRRATRCPASGSRTTARRWASTASTTDACGSTGSGYRGRTCSTGSRTCPRTAPTAARSRARAAASSPCSAPWSRAGSRSVRRASAPRRSRSPWPSATPCSAASSRRPRRTARSLLLDYGLHQRRLLPLLARTYALHFAQEVLTGALHDVFSGIDTDEESRRLLESRAAGTKALATWHATRSIQESREACGGAGYLAVNRFAALKADTDVFTTFEGDNHVLLRTWSPRAC
nr:acyl-CoA dehydrogenase family protein [Nocardioides convexus]